MDYQLPSIEVKTLAEIGSHHDTDKVSHGYCDHYERHFSSFRDHPICLCEIGSWRGASLKMWRDYFHHPESRIVSFDYSPEWTPTAEDNITLEIGDQNDTAFQEAFALRHGPFDIVVDDGGHMPHQHILSFNALFKHVLPGGWYVIEDLHSLYDVCWTKKGDRTIFDVLHSVQESIVVGGGPCDQVHVYGGNWNDGIMFFHRRNAPYTARND